MQNTETKESKHSKREPARKPRIGETVQFWKSQPQSNGTYSLEPMAAIVSGTKIPGGNFQPEDMAICLWLFPARSGSGLEQKTGVIHSPKPADGRWTYFQE